ncbi:MAG TPA: amidohydrolase family protein [Pyrinomonadaceae bacterium]|nr:amidohydrolase family protein [Pyrinomonadaceae bacterium]
MAKLYSARWVLPIASGPLEGGAVAVEGGRVVGVGARRELAEKFRGAEAEDFGEAVIMPGFVNCHTHLELTAMRGFLEDVEGDFFAWLKKLTVARMLRMTAEDLYVSAAWGAVEALRAGVTCVGDASDSAVTTMKALRDVGLRGIVYQEVFGPDANEAREQFEQARDKLASLRAGENEWVTLGVSPHAPYTVSRPLLELLTEHAVSERLPLMMHAAESHAEELFVREGRGPFAESYEARGIEWRAPGVSTVQYLARVGLLRARPLLAHCVRTDEADIETLRESKAGVAHCPKSNAKLGHGRAPFAAFVRAGLDVGLGSDSVASNNTCDLLEEARFAALVSRAAGDTLEGGRMLGDAEALRAATEGGARALGLGHQTGVLVEGKAADLTVVGLGGAHQQPVHDPSTALLFASTGRDVRLTMVAGRELFRDGRVTGVDELELGLRMRDLARRLAGAER